MSAATSSGPPTISACCACSAKSAVRATARSSSTARAPARRRSATTATAPTASTPTCRCRRTSASRRSSRGPIRRRRALGPPGSDYSGRGFYNFTNNLWQVSGGYSQVGENFNPEVGFLPRRGYRRPEFRAFFQPQPKKIAVDSPRCRRTSPTTRSTASTRSCRPRLAHPSVRDSAEAGRPLRLLLRLQQGQSDRAVHGVQSRRPARRHSGRRSIRWGQNAFEYLHNPSARVTGTIRVPLRQLLRRRFQEHRADQRLPHHAEGDREPRLDAAGHRFAGRQLREQPGADQGQLFVHDADQLVGAAAVQRADRAVLVERSLRVAESQRHRACSSSTTIAATRCRRRRSRRWAVRSSSSTRGWSTSRVASESGSGIRSAPMRLKCPAITS